MPTESPLSVDNLFFLLDFAVSDWVLVCYLSHTQARSLYGNSRLGVAVSDCDAVTDCDAVSDCDAVTLLDLPPRSGLCAS